MTGAELATAAKTAGKVLKVARQARKWVEADQARRIIVKRDIVLGRFHDSVKLPGGRGFAAIRDFACPDFAIIDRTMTVFATGDREPFCDGMSLFPDKIGSLDFVKAALGHDAIYSRMEAIATAWGWAVSDVRWLADAMFGDLLRDEAGQQGGAVMLAGNVLSRICHSAVRVFGGIYHAMKWRKKQ